VEKIEQGEWSAITRLAQEAVAGAAGSF
jgi:hypothetical protein